MSIHRAFLLLALLGVVAALVAGCGSSNASSSGSGSNLGQGIVATVGDTKITQAQLDEALKNAEQLYKASKNPFPAAGSPQYKQIQGRALELLVERTEFDQKAKALGIGVTDKQVSDRLDQIKKQSFGGSDKSYRDALKKQGFTDQQVRKDLRGALIAEGLVAKAGSTVHVNLKVSDPEVRTYYEQHTQDYSKPQTRVVRHILVKSKPLADRLYKQVEGGADFAALAKKYSQDPGTKSLGGELTITRGLTYKPFDSAAFALRTGQIAKPVHTRYGWHIIKAEKPATPRQVTPFAQVEKSIRQLLLQQRRQLLTQKQSQAASNWVTAVKKEFCSGKLEFAKGFTPDPDPCASTK